MVDQLGDWRAHQAEAPFQPESWWGLRRRPSPPHGEVEVPVRRASHPRLPRRQPDDERCAVPPCNACVWPARPADWRLQLLAKGLETAIDLGQIHDRASAEHWLRGLLAGPVSFTTRRCWRAPIAPAPPTMRQRGAEPNPAGQPRQPRTASGESVQMGYSLRQLLAALPETASQPLPAALQDGELAFCWPRLGRLPAGLRQSPPWCWRICGAGWETR